ncbi:MAG TPA: alpha/beta hydrolase [Pseudonocardiaceae bacterium]|jgi:pimeloyl-ACP methyl ester carboxylesterase
MTVRTIALPGDLTMTIDEYGTPTGGSGALVLHGGAGPRSVAGLANALSADGYVVVPTHPGFDGTPRPEWIDSIPDLATAYLDLIDALGLTEVSVFGSSIGGWIATEMAVRDNRRALRELVLLGATGIEPTAPLEIADPAKIGPVRTGELAFHNPALRLDPSTLSDEQRAVMLANQQVQALLAPGSFDPKLRGRLHRVGVPVLVLGGEQDGIVPLAYERELADSFPSATFRAIPNAAHFPHIEQPELVLTEIGKFRASAG